MSGQEESPLRGRGLRLGSFVFVCGFRPCGFHVAKPVSSKKVLLCSLTPLTRAPARIADETTPLAQAIPDAVEMPAKRASKGVPESRADHYRHEAEKCRKQADNAVRDDDKAAWLKMAADWQRLVESTDRAALSTKKPSSRDSE